MNNGADFRRKISSRREKEMNISLFHQLKSNNLPKRPMRKCQITGSVDDHFCGSPSTSSRPPKYLVESLLTAIFGAWNCSAVTTRTASITCHLVASANGSGDVTVSLARNTDKIGLLLLLLFFLHRFSFVSIVLYYMYENTSSIWGRTSWLDFRSVKGFLNMSSLKFEHVHI